VWSLVRRGAAYWLLIHIAVAMIARNVRASFSPDLPVTSFLITAIAILGLARAQYAFMREGVFAGNLGVAPAWFWVLPILTAIPLEVAARSLMGAL
jgi:hypothetical protein